MRNITVEIKQVYGNEKIYPHCNTAKTFADIAGTKTLTREVIAHVKSLGYTVEIHQPIGSL